MKEGLRRFTLGAIFALAVVMFFTSINWGLPSHQSDAALFGAHETWTGQQIQDLAGGWDASADRGADIAMHPLTGRDKPIVLNETDAQRAQIVRRFRLYSGQPDEMITFRSLSSMKPSSGDFDPRFYQYGGLWVYPIGALLKLAAMFHLVVLKPNLVFYLDHPEQFARFYLVARCYAALWGMVGVGVVYKLGKEWTGKYFVGVTAAAIYTLMPVVVNMAHEAKPHLPSAVLILATIWAAMRFVKTGQTRFWILAGILCGSAFGMVLTGIVSFAVLPVMTMLRPMSWGSRFKITAAAAGIGLIVFIVTNPYLPMNLVFHHGVVKSNVGNYGNFYRPRFSIAGLQNGVKLLGEGTSFLLAVTAVLGIVFLAMKPGAARLGWLLAAPALLIAGQFFLLAHDQPAEYGRFALTLDIILAIAAACAIGSIPRGRTMIAMVIVLFTGLGGFRYLVNFIADTTNISSRSLAMRTLMGLKNSADVLVVSAEPAPYCLPPVDLFGWKIVLLPRGADANQGNLGANVVSIKAVDTPEPDADYPTWMTAPISWANKPFDIVKR
jgi:hypothetical protein